MTKRRSIPRRAEREAGPIDLLIDAVAAKLEAGDAVDPDELAADYPQHADEVRQLLPTLQAMAELGHSLSESAAGPGPGEPVEGVLGDFRIVREIGRGGMGVVYEAEQISLGRRVALKVLPFAAVLDQRQLQRFQNEAQAAALLHHQHIVPVHFVGCERGVHFYAMQFVDGQTLGKLIGQLRKASGLGPEGRPATTRTARKTAPPTPQPDASTLTLPEMATTASTTQPAFFRSVAQLGIRVAEALDHAHQQGIVHRDIKPSNILVDAQGKPWITDFGLAHIETGPSLTMTGDVLGTLRYMSPEQALAKRVVIDHRTDIYSLAVTLYELLTLRPAFPGTTRQELLRQITLDEPRPPRRLNKAIPADLETILLKAMAKEAAERYATAQHLADDLRRFLDLKPIRAKRPTVLQRAAKWSKRHQPVVWSALAILLVAGIALGVATWRISEAKKRAQQAAGNERAAADREREARSDADEARKKAEQAEQKERALAAERLQRVVALHVAQGVRLMDEGDLLSSLPWLAEASRLDGENASGQASHRIRLAAVLEQCPKPVQIWFHKDPLRHVEFSSDGGRVLTLDHNEARVWNVATGEPTTPPIECRGLNWAEFSPDGRLIVTGTLQARIVRVWDATTGEAVTPPIEADPRYVTFSPDSTRVAVGCQGKTAGVWDARTGKPVTPALRHEDIVRHASFSPDGTRLATACVDELARIWDVTTGRLLESLRPNKWVSQASFSPDGQRLLIAAGDRIEVWNARAGEPMTPVLTLPGSRRASFSPDGQRILTLGNDHTARVWDATTGAAVTPPLKHGGGLTWGAFSPDGLHVVVASHDQTARVWDAANGDSVLPPLRHGGGVVCASFSPHGRYMLTGCLDGTARVWDLAAATPGARALAHRGAVVTASFSPDGSRVLTAHARTARLWHADTGLPAAPPLSHTSRVICASFNGDGGRVVTAYGNCSAGVWDAVSGKPVAALPQRSWRKAKRPAMGLAAFSRDSRLVVMASSRDGRPGVARIWHVATGEPATPSLKRGLPVKDACFSPDSRRLATARGSMFAVGEVGAGAGGLQVWDVGTGKLLFERLGYPVRHVRFSLDGRLLVTAHGGPSSPDGYARVWDAATGKPKGPRLNHTRAVLSASFRHDGRQILTASEDCTARVWDAASGQPVTPPLKHRKEVLDAQFSPDGRWVVTASADQTARVWDATTGRALTPPLKHGGQAHHACFSPDGRCVLTASRDGFARIWQIHRDEPLLEDIDHVVLLLAGQSIDRTGALVPVEKEKLRKTWESLRAKYAESLAASPDQLRASELEKGLDYRQHGQAHAGEERWDAAVECYSKAIGLLPGRTGLWEVRARAHAKLGQWRKVIADASKGIELRPMPYPCHGLWNLRATAHLQLREWDEAVADFSEAIRLYRSCSTCWYLRGVAYARLGQLDKAIADHSEAIERDPMGSLVGAEAHFNRGFAYGNLAQWAEAMADFEHAAKRDKGNPAHHYYAALAALGQHDAEGYRRICADVLEMLGKTADAEAGALVAWTCCLAPAAAGELGRAVQLGDTAVRAQPKSHFHLNTLGAILYRVGDVKRAVELLRQAHEAWEAADPKPARASPAYTWFFLAMTHRRLGNAQEARKWLDQAAKWAQKETKDSARGGPGAESPSWNRRLTLELLRREAEATLGRPAQPTPGRKEGKTERP